MKKKSEIGYNNGKNYAWGVAERLLSFPHYDKYFQISPAEVLKLNTPESLEEKLDSIEELEEMLER